MKIDEKLRLMYVNRWNMVPTSREQSVAEHSYNVVVIAEEIAKRINLRQGERTVDIDWLRKYGILHDQLEALTGDIPTPTKSLLSDIHPMIFDRVAKRLDPRHREELSRCPSIERAIVKSADFIEAILYLERYGVGRYAAKVKNGLVTRFLGLMAKYEETNPYEIDWSIPGEVLRDLRVVM